MDTQARFRAWFEAEGSGEVLSAWLPSFEMAALTSAAQLGGIVWEEERLADGRVSWTQWERDEAGDWLPMLGGFGMEPLRPWES